MYNFIKRSIDIFVSILLLIVFLPVILIAVCLIKLNTPGPVMADTPERVGKKGKNFKMYKLRTMVINAHQILRKDPKYKHLLEQYKRNSYKLKDDPRVTNIGKLLRKHSIDEIPQLLNVLKGDMSLVGPRAYYPDELEDQQKKYPHTRNLVKEVLSVRPGITGAWQVSGRSEVKFDKRITIDTLYIRKKSILYDIVILLKTPWAMISGKGAV